MAGLYDFYSGTRGTSFYLQGGESSSTRSLFHSE